MEEELRRFVPHPDDVDLHPVDAMMADYRRWQMWIRGLESMVNRKNFELAYEDKTGAGRPAVEFEMLERASDRMAARVVQMHRMGIDEREIRLAEGQASELMGLVVKSWDALGLSAEQRQVALRAMRGNPAT